MTDETDYVLSNDQSDEFADIIKTVDELSGVLRNRDDLVLACACEQMRDRLNYLFRTITENNKTIRNKLTLLRIKIDEMKNEQPN